MHKLLGSTRDRQRGRFSLAHLAFKTFFGEYIVTFKKLSYNISVGIDLQNFDNKI